MPKNAKLSARLTTEQRERLAALAMSQQLTESAALRMLIDRTLSQPTVVALPTGKQLQEEPWINA